MSDTMTEPAPTPVPLVMRYGRMWQAVPRELGFLLPTLPIVIVGFVVCVTLLSVGTGLAILFVGLLLVLATMFTARGFGLLELARLRAAGRPAIVPPRWDGAARGQSTAVRLLAPLVDGHYWLYLLHTLVVNFIVGIVTWSIGITWLFAGIAGTFSWLGVVVNPRAVLSGQPVLGFLVGVVLLATLPFVLRGITLTHDAIARGMLGRFQSEGLREQVGELAASRTAAVAAEGTALRRLERDIHDGPQQRLVRLQMDLAAADRQLGGDAADPEAARRLIAEALTQSKDALEELRALSRGFAPPILLDRGLVAAIESLAARGAVPIHLASTLPAGVTLEPELERNAYFIVAEAVTNAAKHAGATRVDIAVALADGSLSLTVIDDGRGGAVETPGHGLAGLAERVRGLGGTLTLTSPAGGPTILAATLPVPAP